MKSVIILGSTGTIGQNTLDIVKAHPGGFRIEALVARGNAALLAQQARSFGARRAVLADAAHYAELKEALSGSGIQAMAGDEAVLETAAMPAGIVMSAIVGAAGLAPTLAAIRAGTPVALANKECLVCAGELVMRELKKHAGILLPVDSEHNGLFQLLENRDFAQVEEVTLTASGGPFRQFSLEQMRAVTPQQAVRHPNWNMGAKISVDSATLMNKGLELIEAQVLFGLAPQQLSVLVHPQSVVHALVRLKDGSVLAQMSPPDMRTPIAHALAWPQRVEAPVAPLDLARTGGLTFEAPDETRFPALTLARAAMQAGGSAPTALNAANEVAVERFLNGAIGFLDIVKIVEKTLDSVDNAKLETLADVMACDAQARKLAQAA